MQKICKTSKHWKATHKYYEADEIARIIATHRWDADEDYVCDQENGTGRKINQSLFI